MTLIPNMRNGESQNFSMSIGDRSGILKMPYTTPMKDEKDFAEVSTMHLLNERSNSGTPEQHNGPPSPPAIANEPTL